MKYYLLERQKYIKYFTGESITRLYDLDNLVEFYITPMPNYPSIE